ncbi:class I SAM-dependent methyltransferase [Shewanella waksmanii]|uniref:class I SAM-dependent methyltransferase n=1 Tax=Shewanella waksmanii TaxID=213783 RepID=UPI00048F74CD|nr:class I SAM-dependent methyltransferase [Shewanella waksmanii]
MPEESKHHRGPVIDKVDNKEVVDCQVCGFKHVLPLPTKAEQEDFYRQDFYESEKPLFFKQKEEDESWLTLQYSDRYDTFESSLPDSRRRILDVGTGPGFFLKHGKSRGWEVKGIEPSTSAAQYANTMGLDVDEAFLDASNSNKLGKFDVVHASLVLEHVYNPIELIQLMHSMLEEGGLLCITVPNDYNPFQATLREVDTFQPWWVCPTHHVNYFSPHSLSTLISNSGFTILLKETSFPMDLFLLMGDNYVNDGKLGRTCHHKRVAFDTKLANAGRNDLKRKLYQAFAELDIGREICIYAKKN